ncbi:MAG: hypothetical protein M1829_001683 [Trizodia sp. TS-e1964]|nr:MAG: hypothetical protein M1829_001683 [Trizodia sp. TS-e1964]
MTRRCPLQQQQRQQKKKKQEKRENAPGMAPPFSPPYPAFCFPASPTYNTWARVSSSTLHSLRTTREFQPQHIYFHNAHPIRFVAVVGAVVALDELAARWLLQLDDSAGGSAAALVSVVVPKSPGGAGEIDMARLALGQVLLVKGTLDTFRGQRQVVGRRIRTGSPFSFFLSFFLSFFFVDVRLWKGLMSLGTLSTAEEVVAWGRCVEFERAVLGRSWVLAREEVRALRRDAGGGVMGEGAAREESRGRVADAAASATADSASATASASASPAAASPAAASPAAAAAAATTTTATTTTTTTAAAEERACRMEMAKRMARGRFDVLGI